jgi:hypothetical protein
VRSVHSIREDRKIVPTIGVNGIRWPLGRVTNMVYLIQTARTTAFGTLRLPDENYVFHKVTKAQLQDIINAVSDYQRSLLTWAEAKVLAIRASPNPESIPLNDYPLPP